MTFFDKPKNYVDLFEQEVNAIFHVILQKFIDPDPPTATTTTTSFGVAVTQVTPFTVTTSTGPSNIGFTGPGPRTSGG